MRVDWDDDQFVDLDNLDAFRARTLDVGPLSGDHDGKVVAVGRLAAWIDEGLAELIHLLWQDDIWTESSCQDVYDDGTTALIGFADIEELRDFLRVAVPYDETPGGLYDRATGCNVDPDATGGWEYDLFPKGALSTADGTLADYILSVSVLFPVADVPALVANVSR